MNNFDTQLKLTKAKLFVFGQAILLLLLIFSRSPIELNLVSFTSVGIGLEILGALGVLVSAFSLKHSLTVMPLPKQDSTLVTTGLYRFSRHPMYASVLAFSLGLSMKGGEVYKYLLFLLLLILFYYKSKYEESFLQEKFAGYKLYSRTVPRLLPFRIKHLRRQNKSI